MIKNKQTSWLEGIEMHTKATGTRRSERPGSPGETPSFAPRICRCGGGRSPATHAYSAQRPVEPDSCLPDSWSLGTTPPPPHTYTDDAFRLCCILQGKNNRACTFYAAPLCIYTQALA